jgi:glycosyltransferase involved in cell wall biosynthesis
MLLAQNDIETDPRVTKAFEAATDAGYEVKVCCYKDYPETTSNEVVDRIRMLFSRGVGLYKRTKAIDVHKNGKAHRSPINIPMAVASSGVVFTLHQIDLFLKTKKYRAEIVHANDLNTLFAGVLHKWFCGSRLIYDSHEIWVDMVYSYPRWVKKLLSLYEQFLIHHYVDEMITVNDRIADEFLIRYKIRKPHVVMNVPYLEKVNQPSHEGIRVIYQGKFDPGRYLENVVRGAKHFSPGITLTMRGVGDYGETLKKCVQSDNVTFLPPVPMELLIQSLSGYDIGVATGAHKQGKNGEYASPNKLFEYMMAGLVVVGDDSKVISDIIVNGNCGSTFSGDDPVSFACAINAIASDHGEMNQLKENSLSYVREQYCWENEQKKLIEVYRRCEQPI